MTSRRQALFDLALHALECSGIAIVPAGRRRPTDVATQGMTRSRLREIVRNITEQSPTEPPTERVLQTCADEWVHVIPLDMGHKRVGTMIAVWRDQETPKVESESVYAFTNHFASALLLDRRRQTGSADAELPLDLVNRIVLTTEGFASFTAALDTILHSKLPGVRSGLMLWDPSAEVLQMTEGSFGADDVLTSSYWVHPTDCSSNAARVFSTGQPFLSNHPRDDPAVLRDYAEIFDLARLITVPLDAGSERIGVLHVADHTGVFRPEDLQLVMSWAPQIAYAVKLAKARYDLRRDSQVEGVLGELAASIATGKRIKTTLQQTLERLCAVTDTELLAIVPVDAAPIVGRRHGQPVAQEQDVIEQASAHPPAGNIVSGTPRAGEPGTSLLFTPLRLGAKRAGTLCTLRLRGQPFGRSERQTYLRLGGLVSLAWAAERYQQQRAELARLQERSRIADELHDNVAQILFAAQMRLDEMETCDEDRRPTALRETRALLSRAEGAIREVIHQLSDVPDDGPLGRLAAVVADVEHDFGIAIHMDTTDFRPHEHDIPRRIFEVVLAGARECLVNAAKHNPPSCRIMISLRSTADRVSMSVVDDGKGMEPGAIRRGHGLSALRRSVRLRGGRMTVRAVPGGGTHVRISLPLT